LKINYCVCSNCRIILEGEIEIIWEKNNILWLEEELMCMYQLCVNTESGIFNYLEKILYSVCVGEQMFL
jgi:hypothetical protein